MEREKPRSRKKKRLGVKFWAAVCGGIAVAALKMAPIILTRMVLTVRIAAAP